VPDFAPINEPIENTRLRTKFATRVPLGTEIDKFGMPIGVPRLMREIAITTTADTPPEPGAFTSIDIVDRAEHTVMWPDGNEHQIGWLRTRRANPRGESGPYSMKTMVDING